MTLTNAIIILILFCNYAGPNGAGKSTLLKLIFGELIPTHGQIRKNSHLRFGRYHQHLHELLDLDMSPLDYMMKCFPDIKEREEMRKIIGRYGLSGKQQVRTFDNEQTVTNSQLKKPRFDRQLFFCCFFCRQVLYDSCLMVRDVE